MTNEELDRARVEEALRVGNGVNMALHAARLAREGWTPPEPVDPDLAEANRVYEAMDWPDSLKGDTAECYIEFIREGIKRGRELERAEAKPGVVWVKHDGSGMSPVDGDDLVWVRFRGEPNRAVFYQAGIVNWRNVTHYAIITQPEGSK